MNEILNQIDQELENVIRLNDEMKKTIEEALNPEPKEEFDAWAEGLTKEEDYGDLRE